MLELGNKQKRSYVAVPKKKTSPSRRGMRNAHRSIAITLTNECSNCGSLALPHHVCDICGYYKGTKVMVTRADKSRTRKESTVS